VAQSALKLDLDSVLINLFHCVAFLIGEGFPLL